MKGYSGKNARRDLAWLADTRVIQAWSQLDDNNPARFTVTTLDGREHALELAEVRSFWRGALSGWRAARTSVPAGAADDSEVPS